MGIVTRLACGRLKSEGVEVKALLQKAGLTEQQIDDPCSRLAVKDQIRFLDLAAEVLKDERLGFHLAQTFDLRMSGLFYYVLASSETLGEALRRAARYSAIVNECITLTLREVRDVGISLRYAGVARHSDRQQIDFWTVVIFRLCRQLTNRQLPTRRVNFAHRRSGEPAEFKSFFGSDVVFGAPADEMAFSGSIKEMAVVSADPYLNEILITYCEQELGGCERKAN